MFVADKRTLEQWGSERIRRGLAERGVDRELAEQALAVGRRPRRGDERGGPSSTARSSCCAGASQSLRASGATAIGRFSMLLRKGYESELAVDALAAHAARCLSRLSRSGRARAAIAEASFRYYDEPQ